MKKQTVLLCALAACVFIFANGTLHAGTITSFTNEITEEKEDRDKTDVEGSKTDKTDVEGSKTDGTDVEGSKKTNTNAAPSSTSDTPIKERTNGVYEENNESIAEQFFGAIFEFTFQLIGHGFVHLEGWNARQRYLSYPYEEEIPFNAHENDGTKRSYLLTTFEYNDYDGWLSSGRIDLDLTFLSILRLKGGTTMLVEKTAGDTYDTLTMPYVLGGINLITFDNFIIDVLAGVRYITDVDTALMSWGFLARVFPVKPVVFDTSIFFGSFGAIDTLDYRFRVGWLMGRFDLGVGYTYQILGSSKKHGFLVSGRLWF